MVSKVNMLLGIIKMLTGNDNQHVFSSLYMSVVRRILEYAILLLSPSVIKDIESIENVQRRVSRLALKQKRGGMNHENFVGY